MNDVKSVVKCLPNLCNFYTKSVQFLYKISTIFMTKHDDDFQIRLFREVKEMNMHVEDTCLELINLMMRL